MGAFYYTGGMYGAFYVISNILSKIAVNFKFHCYAYVFYGSWLCEFNFQDLFVDVTSTSIGHKYS